MEITQYPNFMPSSLPTKYFSQWKCDIDSKINKNVYYKCLQGYAQIDLENGCKYKGQIRNGLFQGKGLFQWPNGMNYEGSFKASHIQGIGKYTWPNGSFYQGQVTDGKKNGFGVFYSSTQKYTYTGQWKQGEKQGKGKIQYKDTSVYEGEFSNNRRNGNGKMIYSSKNQYEGQWVNDKKQGKGTMNWWNNHQKYYGQWKQDMPDGYGQYFWYQNKTEYKIFKNVYKGYWKKGKRSGFGVFFYSNGCKYQGYFLQDIKQGPGITTDEKGITKIQMFSCNRLLQINSNKSKNHLTSQTKQMQKKSSKTNIKSHSKNQSEFTIKKQPTQTSQLNKTAISLNIVKQTQRSVQNQYVKYLDFTHKQFNQNFYNSLLRNNTRLRNLYKLISTSNNQLKDFYSGMVLQNYWKALRQCKLISQNCSLVTIDRQFTKGKKWYFDINLPNQQNIKILQKQGNFDTSINYQDILWNDYFTKINSSSTTIINWQQFKLVNTNTNTNNIQNLIKPKPNPIDIHNPSTIILFRHFICLIIHTCILLDQSQKSLKQKLQSLIQNLQHIYDNNNNIKNQKNQDNNTLTTSTRIINIPQWVKNINQQLIQQLQYQNKCIDSNNDNSNNNSSNSNKYKYRYDLDGKIDISIPVRKLYSILQLGNIFKDQNEKYLYIQKIQKYLNIKNSPLRKQYRQIYTDLDKYIKIKINPYFNYIMNYQLNIKQFNQFLFLVINKKIIANNQQDFQNKYKEIVKMLIMEVRNSCNNNNNNNSNSNNNNNSHCNCNNNGNTKSLNKQNQKLKLRMKKVIPQKDKIKKTLIIQMQRKKIQKQEQQINNKRKQQQQLQRKLMNKQDYDAQDITLENQQQPQEY